MTTPSIVNETAAALRHAMANERASATLTQWEVMIDRVYGDEADGRWHVCQALQTYLGLLVLLGECQHGFRLARINTNNQVYSCGQCEECAEHDWQLNVRWKQHV
jgi:hypothetical protein